MGLQDQQVIAVKDILCSLESQAGLDTLPARVSLIRILNAVHKQTGYQFKFLAQGRHRAVFDIVSPHADLGLVLKVGNKQSNARELALSFKYPEDWAHIFGAFDYGIIAERVGTIDKISDPRIQTPEFQARAEELAKRYLDVTYRDIGYVGERIVLIGSSIRVLSKDANGQQQRAV